MEKPAVSRLFAIQAEKLLKEGNVRDAIRLCEEGLAAYPDYATAFTILSRAYFEKKMFPQAFSTIRRGIEKFPLNPVLRKTLEELENRQIVDYDLSVDDDAEEEAVAGSTEEPADTGAEPAPAENSMLQDTGGEEEDSQDPAPEMPAIIETAEEEPRTEPEAEPEIQEFIPVEPEKAEISVPVPESLPAPSEEPVSYNVSAPGPLAGDEPAERPVVPGPEKIIAIPGAAVPQEIPAPEPKKTVSAPALHETAPETRQKLFVEHKSERHSPLRIIETIKNDEERVRKSLKSTNIRLIPGLEFTPLRFEGSKKHSRLLQVLPDPPAFRPFKIAHRQKEVAASSMFTRQESQGYLPASRDPGIFGRRDKVAGTLTPLEELAFRLEKARIPVIHEESSSRSSGLSVGEPSVVSETMAKIYEKQGAYGEALRAYQILAEQRPEKKDFYEKKIRELKDKVKE